MAASAVLGIAASVALPYILKALAKKAPAVAAKAMASKAAWTPIVLKTGQTVYRNPATGKIVAAKNVPTSLVPTAKSKFIESAGKTAGALGTAGTFAIPLAIGLGGRGIQAGATGLGALTSAVGQMPGHFDLTPDIKKSLYGATPSSALGGIAGGVGQAAGLGVSALGNAVGSSVNDLSNTLRLQDLQSGLHQRMLGQAADIKSLNLKPGELDLLGRMSSAQGRSIR